jgi:hypothetical protein
MKKPTNAERLFGPLIVAASLCFSGCNNCEKLTEKVCAELGKDCELWKEIGGPDQITPQGRKVNRACGTILDNELALEGTVNSARGTVLAERLKRAIAKKDQAEIDKVKGELEENKKRIEAGLEKVKKQVGR